MANMQSMNRTEALRLADALSQGRYLTTDAGNPIAEAAAELRRLHAELAQLREKRQPLSPLEAIKLGMKADDECRKHARGTTNWACAMTRFYEAAHNITGEPA